MPEVLGDVLKLPQPGGETWFFSTCEEEYKTKTNVGKHRMFIKVQVHMCEGIAGKLKEPFSLRRS